MLLLAFCNSAAAQGSPGVTLDNLIGSSVSDLGTGNYSNVEQAIERFRAGDVRSAQQFLINARKEHPQLPPADVLLAKLQLAYRNGGAARALLERAVMGEPNDPEAYILFADQAYAARRLTEAESLYDRAAPLIGELANNQKRKRNFLIRLHAGQSAVQERRGKFDEALTHLQAWVKEDPDSATAHHRLGSTLFRLGKPKEGYDEFNAAKVLDDKLPHPDVTTGSLFHRMGQDDDARSAYERAVKLDGKNADTLFAYAQFLLEMGEAETARKPLADARLLKPDNSKLMLFSGVASKMTGDLDEAEQFLLDALARAPTSQDVLNQLALTLADTDDDDKKQRALQFAQVSSTLFPKDNESAVTLGWAYYRLGRLLEAERAIQNAIKLGKLNSDSSYLIAKILFEQDKTADAARILDSVVDDEGIFVHRRDAEQLSSQIKRERN